MSEKAQSDISFGTEPFPDLRDKAMVRIHSLLTEDGVPEEARREWLLDYFRSEIVTDTIGVWQQMTEAVFNKLGTDEVAATFPSVWAQGYFPPEYAGPWEQTIGHLRLSTGDTSDLNHVFGRPTLDKLQYIYDKGFVVDERDHRARALAALLEAKPDVFICQYDVSDTPIMPSFTEPATHIRGDGFYGRSRPGTFLISYPSGQTFEQYATGEIGGSQLTIDQMLTHCGSIAAYNQIYGELAQSVAFGSATIREPEVYLTEDWADAEHTTIQLFEV